MTDTESFRQALATKLAKAAIQRGHTQAKQRESTTTEKDGDTQKNLSEKQKERRKQVLLQIARESFGELAQQQRQQQQQQPTHGEEDSLVEVVADSTSRDANDEEKVLKESAHYGAPVKQSLSAEPHSKSKSLRKKERAQQPETAGKGWFDMEAPVLTDQVKRDLEVLKNRNYIDPKRFFKTKEEKKSPKFFQIGTVVEGALEGRSRRLTKKQRPQSFFQEIAKDDRVKAYAKRNYSQMLQTSLSGRVPKSQRGKKRKRN